MANDSKKDHLQPKERVTTSETTFLDEVMRADPQQPVNEPAYQFTGRNFLRPKNPYA